MRWWLQLEGQSPQLTIQPDDVGSSDEFLCGRCGALLAVDHQLWANAAPVMTSLICSVCQARNVPNHATRAEA